MTQAKNEHTPSPQVLKLAQAYGRLCATQDFETETHDSGLLALIALHKTNVTLHKEASCNRAEDLAEALYERIVEIELEIQNTPAHTFGGALAKVGVLEQWLGKDLSLERLQHECVGGDMAKSIVADLSRLARRQGSHDA